MCNNFFYTGLKNLGSLVSQIFFCLQPGILAMVRLPATNPAKQLTFLLFTSAEGKESPLPFCGPSQSFGFSLLPLGVRRPEVTKYQYLLISPLWPTFFHNGSFQREDSINLISIVSVGYQVTSPSLREERDNRNTIKKRQFISLFSLLFFPLFFSHFTFLLSPFSFTLWRILSFSFFRPS